MREMGSTWGSSSISLMPWPLKSSVLHSVPTAKRKNLLQSCHKEQSLKLDTVLFTSYKQKFIYSLNDKKIDRRVRRHRFSLWWNCLSGKWIGSMYISIGDGFKEGRGICKKDNWSKEVNEVQILWHLEIDSILGIFLMDICIEMIPTLLSI